MNSHQRRPLNRTLSLGLVFLVIANVAKFMLERHTAMPEGPRDLLSGLLMGIALGCLMLGIWRMRRDDGASDDPACR